jgi:hypothetical protein
MPTISEKPIAFVEIKSVAMSKKTTLLLAPRHKLAKIIANNAPIQPQMWQPVLTAPGNGLVAVAPLFVNVALPAVEESVNTSAVSGLLVNVALAAKKLPLRCTLVSRRSRRIARTS